MKRNFYTVGYQNYSVSQLIDTLKEKDLMLIDIRYNPFTKSAYYHHNTFATTCSNNGIQYFWLRSFGNQNWFGAFSDLDLPIKIDNIEHGLSVLNQVHKHFRKDPALMCACKDYDKCHRKMVRDTLMLHEWFNLGDL